MIEHPSHWYDWCLGIVFIFCCLVFTKLSGVVCCIQFLSKGWFHLECLATYQEDEPIYCHVLILAGGFNVLWGFMFKTQDLRRIPETLTKSNDVSKKLVLKSCTAQLKPLSALPRSSRPSKLESWFLMISLYCLPLSSRNAMIQSVIQSEAKVQKVSSLEFLGYSPKRWVLRSQKAGIRQITRWFRRRGLFIPDHCCLFGDFLLCTMVKHPWNHHLG